MKCQTPKRYNEFVLPVCEAVILFLKEACEEEPNVGPHENSQVIAGGSGLVLYLRS